MAPYLITFALPYHLLPGNRTKCGVWSALSYGLFTALFTAITNNDPGLLWPILLVLGAVLCKERVGEKQGMLLLPVHCHLPVSWVQRTVITKAHCCGCCVSWATITPLPARCLAC